MIGTPTEYWVFTQSADLEAWLSGQVSLTVVITSRYMLLKSGPKVSTGSDGGTVRKMTLKGKTLL